MNRIDSQNAQIRAHLEAGKSINPMDALQLYGCFRLGGRIHDLREAGMPIKTTMITWNGKRFAEYSLLTD